VRTEQIDAFEAKAKELVADAISLSMENEVATAWPKPDYSISNLVQLVVVGFTEITKLLIFVFRCAAKND